MLVKSRLEPSSTIYHIPDVGDSPPLFTMHLLGLPATTVTGSNLVKQVVGIMPSFTLGGLIIIVTSLILSKVPSVPAVSFIPILKL